MSNKLKELLSESKEDIQIDLLALENEMINSPLTYSKWLTYHQTQRAKLTIVESEHKRLVALKTKYYMGKMDDEQREELGWPLEGTKILKADLSIWLDSDDDVIISKQKLELQYQIVDLIEKTMSAISDKRWTVKNYIDYKRWSEGG